MRKNLFLALSTIFSFLILSCSFSSKKCEEEYIKAKKNYQAYLMNYDTNMAEISLKQINQSLECDDNLEEKLNIKLSLLLFLKKFQEAKKLAYEHADLPKFSYIGNKVAATEYVTMIECFDKKDKKCVRQKVDFLTTELKKKVNKDEKYYMIYYDLKSYVDNKKTMRAEIDQNPNLSNEQKQLLTDFIQYNDNPLGPYAEDGPFSKSP